MKDTNYLYLVSSLKSDIRVAKSLIKQFELDKEKAVQEGYNYGQGLYTGWIASLEEKVKESERRLKIIGEELEDGPQPGSLEPVTR